MDAILRAPTRTQASSRPRRSGISQSASLSRLKTWGNLSADRASSGDASKRSSGTWRPDDYDVIDANGRDIGRDRNTLRLRLDPQGDANGLEPGMTAWLSR
jgi:hypothetical protein